MLFGHLLCVLGLEALQLCGKRQWLSSSSDTRNYAAALSRERAWRTLGLFLWQPYFGQHCFLIVLESGPRFASALVRRFAVAALHVHVHTSSISIFTLSLFLKVRRPLTIYYSLFTIFTPNHYLLFSLSPIIPSTQATRTRETRH